MNLAKKRIKNLKTVLNMAVRFISTSLTVILFFRSAMTAHYSIEIEYIHDNVDNFRAPHRRSRFIIYSYTIETWNDMTGTFVFRVTAAFAISLV